MLSRCGFDNALNAPASRSELSFRKFDIFRIIDRSILFCQVLDFVVNRRSSLLLKKFSLEIQSYIDQAYQHRHFHERSDNRSEGLS